MEMNRLLTGMIQVIQETDTNTGQPLCNEHSCPTMSAGRYALLLFSHPLFILISSDCSITASHILGSKMDGRLKSPPRLTLSVSKDGLLARSMIRMSSPPTLLQLLLPRLTPRGTWAQLLLVPIPRSLLLPPISPSPSPHCQA